MSTADPANRSWFPEWTSNQLFAGLFLALISSILTGIATLAVTYLVFNSRLVSAEYKLQGIESLTTEIVSLGTELQNVKTEVARLNDKTAKVDDLRVNQQRLDSDFSVIFQKVQDYADEIASLRAKVNNCEIFDGKLETITNTTIGKLSQLEIDSKMLDAQISSLRERVARVETRSDDGKAIAAEM